MFPPPTWYMVWPWTVIVATSGLSMMILLLGVSIMTRVTSSSCWTCMPIRCIIRLASRGLTFRRIITVSLQTKWVCLLSLSILNPVSDFHGDSGPEAEHLLGVEQGSAHRQQTVPTIHHQYLLSGTYLGVDGANLFFQ